MDIPADVRAAVLRASRQAKRAAKFARKQRGEAFARPDKRTREAERAARAARIDASNARSYGAERAMIVAQQRKARVVPTITRAAPVHASDNGAIVRTAAHLPSYRAVMRMNTSPKSGNGNVRALSEARAIRFGLLPPKKPQG